MPLTLDFGGAGAGHNYFILAGANGPHSPNSLGMLELTRSTLVAARAAFTRSALALARFVGSTLTWSVAVFGVSPGSGGPVSFGVLP